MPDIWGLAAIAAKLGLYLGVLTSAGLVFAALIFQVTGIRLLTAVFGVLALVAAIAGFALNGAALTGDASGLTDPEMLGLLWSTQVGTALVLRLAGVALLLMGLFFGPMGLWLSALGGILALFSFAIIGHVPDRETIWLNALLIFHLAAVSTWIGILTPLKRLTSIGKPADAALLGHRFGRLASIFVPLLILAGVVMGYVLSGSVSALLTTAYGQALLIKVLLVAGLLGLAALNKLRFVPRLADGDAYAARDLSKSISLEWVTVLAILLITAVLTSVLTLPS